MRFLFLSTLFLVPLVTFAQNFESIVNIPLPGGGGNAQSLEDYINAIYALSISIAALLAVIKIVIAGVKWMTTDIVTTKGDAKKDIQGAILGLLIIVGAVIIIAIINPNIGDVDFTANTLPAPKATTANNTANMSDADVACNSYSLGCEKRACDALGDYTWQLIGGGAIAGSAFLPGVGTTIGALIGGAAGWSAQLAGNEAECQTVCTWLGGGIHTDKNNERVCVHSPDAKAQKEADLLATRQQIANNIGCADVDDLVTLQGVDPYCTAVSDKEATNIINSIGIVIDQELADSISNRIGNYTGSETVITDEAIITLFESTTGVEDSLFLMSAPLNVLSPDYTQVERIVEGICRDIGAKLATDAGVVQQNMIGGNYIGCASY